MPPVNTSASSTDVDNEATAELPMLDIAAYESTLETIAHTDSWVVPAGLATPAADATVQMPAIKSEAIPTLRSAEPEPYDGLDHSGTHEMPVARRPCFLAHNGGVAAREAVEELRLADVGSPDDGDDGNIS